MSDAPGPARTVLWAPRRTGASAPRRLVALLVLGVASLSACGGSGGDDGSAGSTAGSTSGSTSAPVTSAPVASAGTSSDSSSAPAASSGAATGAAASGEVVTLKSLSFHLPAGWQIQSSDDVSATGFDPTTSAGQGSVIVFDQRSFGGETLDSEAKLAVQTANSTGVHPVRQPNATVNGVEGYVVTGSNKTYTVYYQYGTVTNGHDVTLLFQYSDQAPDAQATVASVLASIAWT